MTPDEIADIEASLLFGGATILSREQALGIITAWKLLQREHRQATTELGHARTLVLNIRSMAGWSFDAAPGLPPEWATPWRLRAERAEVRAGQADERLALIVAACKKEWDARRLYHQERHRLRGNEWDHRVATAYARAMDDLDKAVAAHPIEEASGGGA
ncbi:hypothetical protein Aple_010490 [Acrocarpospora pleiomorpha]|uniref:Uncharacterized protein n=1 Tax=Acrocarpospora pleiomorpha TaxID=90975 RepID=A0A5M3XAI9_9ACTN|nr:hypothetical protein [Acrocarpospora pleiomorpha]GES18154.1 hypothetical protein Aple_010490 [Acrocarpospora pleiomorpha]